MSTGTQASKLLMPNQWARSHRLQTQQGHMHANYQYQINGQDLESLFLKTRNRLLSHCNQREYIPTNVYLDIYVTD